MENLIEFIDIKGFQSQYDTRIDFSPGMTALTGLSMDGKTAILRAFEFVRTNRPAGFSFNYRYEEVITSVSVGIAGHIITHKKSKKALNKEGHKALYIVKFPNGEETEFSAYGTKVPDLVSEIFNISDISIQSQLDPYMLVLSTAGQIATTINKITGIDESDKWFKIIRKTLTGLKAEEAVLKTQQDELSKGILGLAWTDEAKILIEKAENLNWDYEKTIRDANAILDLVNVNSAAEAKIRAIASQLKGFRELLSKLGGAELKLAENRTRKAQSVEYYRIKEANDRNLAHYEAIYPELSLIQSVEAEIKTNNEWYDFKQFYGNQSLMLGITQNELNSEKDKLTTLLIERGECHICGSELTDWEKVRESI